MATPRHDVAVEYVDVLQKEILTVSGILGKKRDVASVHFGGGTPTYLSPSELEAVYASLNSTFNISDDIEASIEIDPRVTSTEHLKALRGLGFNRLSLGVQDFSERVQRAIGRIEPPDIVRKVVCEARGLGFRGVNVDLIYGLPRQTGDSFLKTLDEVMALSPDRLACFNFAYLPSILKGQRNISGEDLPTREVKFGIFCSAIERFQERGYKFIGIDHFAKESDALFTAHKKKRLTRGFQGYSSLRGGDLLGFGLSAISEISGCYAQNVKKLADYFKIVRSGEIAVDRGWQLTEDDRVRKKVIQDLFCDSEADVSAVRVDRDKLLEFADDRLIEIDGKKIKITPLGRLFVRNIAAEFDAYLDAKNAGFSRGV